MLAAAFLTITTAAEHARGPAPDGQIPLTRNETGRLLATLVIRPVHGIWHRSNGRPGDAAASTVPRTATTSGKPASYEDHDLRLEYQSDVPDVGREQNRQPASSKWVPSLPLMGTYPDVPGGPVRVAC